MESNENQIVDYQGMIIIHGDLYEFAKSGNGISLYGDPSHKLTFQHLDKSWGSYSGGYSVQKKDFVDVVDFLRNINKTLNTIIPVRIIDEREKLTEEDIREYNELSLNRKHGYHYVDKGLSERLNGTLPIIDLYGKNYHVDIKNAQLIPADGIKKSIQFNRCDLFEPSVILYDISTHSQVKMNESQKQLYPNVVGVKFPALQELDIIARAEMSGLPATSLLCAMPWRPDQTKIETIELSDVNITRLNLHNKKQQELEKKAGVLKDQKIRGVKRQK
ncbi:hypothetical protein [Chitinophaga niabensis]|uniref:Uncharacterized protein n=1 Tax=Chitinophaga niabensis TaxID=536979 RepID=A0A1N6E4I7_9BACT|nr:hypothetical protein [Chitinophaga niabensis]SIN77950.1 hypothetical protein SAMN04488055_1298 [Chitinophaga niabensis]